MIVVVGLLIGICITGLALLSTVTAIAMAGCSSIVIDERLIRLVDDGLDFTHAARYPSIDHDHQMRLLDNGAVVYARRTGLNVQLKVCEALNAQCPDIWY